MKALDLSKTTIWLISGAITAAFASAALADGDPGRGAQAFRACIACHSIRPGEQLTGPSLAGVFGRRAGTLEGYARYSDALRKSDIVWNEKALDAWLADPRKFIPGNAMTISGLPDAGQRADLIAFLRNPQSAAQAARGRMGEMMTAARLENLRDVEPQARVTAIRYCKDSYFVTLDTGRTFPFWEFNVRFKTDASAEGPPAGKPVILHAGMRGDRAFVVFASPDEISKFIRQRCE